MKLSLLIALSLITPQLFANSKVIYGIDNRIDLFETDSQFLLDLAASTAAMIPNNRITSNGDMVEASRLLPFALDSVNNDTFLIYERKS